MDTTRALDQITEWGSPTETLETAPNGTRCVCGMRHPERVTYLVWCMREAKRLGGRVKKSSVKHGDHNDTVIAVFA